MGIKLKQYLLLLGGFLGFSTVFATGLVVQNDVVQILFNASIGCVVGGLLFKWVGTVIVECQVSQKRAAMKAQEEAAMAAAASNKKGAGR